MARRLTYEEVKYFIEVESDSGCKLLSEEYVNNSTEMRIKCSCGDEFKTTFARFKNKTKRKRTCNKCSINRMTEKSKHDYCYIKKEVEAKGCKLISKEYINRNEPLTIRCKCGEVFQRAFATFNDRRQSSHYCGNCSGRIAWDYDKVLNFVNKNSDCELLDVEYITNTDPLTFKCNCGEIFKTTFAKFKDRDKRQCNKCSNKEKWNYKRALDMVSRYSNCELVNDPHDYFSSNTQLKLKCSCQTIFYVYPRHFIHENKRECYECKIKNSRTGGRLFYEEIKDYIENESQSGCILNTSADEYIDTQNKLSIKCNCGSIFYRSYAVFTRGVFTCRSCSLKASSGEIRVLEVLEDNDVPYISEYWFDNLRSNKNRPLQFDFAVSVEGKIALLIEYDGQQHFRPVNFGGMSGKRAVKDHKKTLYHDKLKNQYCKDNDIPLLRIPYWDFDNIEQILEEWLVKHGVIHKNEKTA